MPSEEARFPLHRQREKQGVKLRKSAEKLLLAHLKKRALDTVQGEQALQAAKSPPKRRRKTQSQVSPPTHPLHA